MREKERGGGKQKICIISSLYTVFCRCCETSGEKMVAEGESAPSAALNLIKHARDFTRRKPSIAPFLIYSSSLREKGVVNAGERNFANSSPKVSCLGSCGCDNVAASATYRKNRVLQNVYTVVCTLILCLLFVYAVAISAKRYSLLI